tara:strand:+ start:651 stop:1634 length:984 start_codon:yes stop_codon:yes gene_type:complete
MKQSCITIIGAGHIGSRHLQALCHLEHPIRIDLVDPSDESLQTAQDRYEEVASPGKQAIELHCHNSLGDLPDTLDLIIIATNSLVREKVLRDVIRKRPVKNLILEKVLFQRTEQYIKVESLLKESSIPTWVSCWMRTTNLYKRIKSLLDHEEKIQMKIEGPLWGMGCNSIHFMDLFSYLTNTEDFKFTNNELENKVLESKRTGFKEFSGRLEGQSSHGHTLELICYETGKEPTTVKILNGSESFRISGLLGDVVLETSNKNKNYMEKTYLPYQSQLTHLWTNQILEKGSCDLPTYAESMLLHLELIRVFTNHLEKVTKKEINACPIT